MSKGHNPYVGIQRTVFEQGWQRALKDFEKRWAAFRKDNGEGMEHTSTTEANLVRILDEVRNA